MRQRTVSEVTSERATQDRASAVGQYLRGRRRRAFTRHENLHAVGVEATRPFGSARVKPAH